MTLGQKPLPDHGKRRLPAPLRELQAVRKTSGGSTPLPEGLQFWRELLLTERDLRRGAAVLRMTAAEEGLDIKDQLGQLRHRMQRMGETQALEVLAPKRQLGAGRRVQGLRLLLLLLLPGSTVLRLAADRTLSQRIQWWNRR